MTAMHVTRADVHESPPDLTLWLVSSAARLSLSKSREDLLARTSEAVQKLGLPVLELTSSEESPQESNPNGSIVHAVVAPGGCRLAVGLEDGQIDGSMQAAIVELLKIVDGMLDRYPETSALSETQSVNEELDELEQVLGHADDKASSLQRLLNVAARTFDPDVAVIIRDEPLSILHVQRRHPEVASPGARDWLRQVAASMLERMPGNESGVFCDSFTDEDNDKTHVYCVRLSDDESATLVLMLMYMGKDAGRVVDRAAIGALGKRVRASQQLQTAVGGGDINHNYLHALNEATLAAASTHNLNELYEAVRAALSTVLPTDATLIATIPEGSDEAICVYRSEGDNSYFEPAPLSTAFQTGMKLGRPFIVDEIPGHLNAPGYRFGDPTRRVQSLAGAPLVANERVTGLIVAQSYEKAAFRIEHADLLLDIGRSIAVAVERAQLIDRLKTRSVREAAMRSLTQKLTTSLHIPDLLNHVVSEMSAVMENVLVAAVHVDESVIPTARYAAARGPEPLMRALGILPVGDLVPDGAADHAIASCQSRDGVVDERAIIVLPLHDDSTCIGTLIFARESRVPFSEGDRSTFAILEGIVASALRNALLYRDRERDESDLVEVSRISRLVASSLDTSNILKEILASLPALFHSEGCSVRIVDGQELVPLAVHGDIVHSFADRIPIATSLAGTIVRDKKLLAVEDLHSHPATGRHARRTGVKVRGWLAVPMIDEDGEVFAILSIHSDYPRRWTERDKVLLQTLAESTTIAIQNAWRFSRTRDILLASVESLANAVDAKDPTTLNHSRNVSTYARTIAEAMELPAQQVENIALAGLLHDIGKIGIPDRILQKPDVLDIQEWSHMKTHPVIGEQILSGNVHLMPVLPIVRHHHERWDGMGYPDNLHGKDIPLGAAIVALADAVDTMASERPYRKAMPWHFVRQVIKEEAGRQFDPDVVRRFIALVDAGRVRPLGNISDARTLSLAGAQPPTMSLDARALMIFHGVAREIRALTDLETFIANVTVVIRGVMELSDIQIFLVDEESGEIYYRPTSGDRERGFAATRRAIGEGVVGWVVQHAEPLLVSDVRQDERFIYGSVTDVRSELAVPLIVDDMVIGAINVESSVVSAFSEGDVRLLTATAANLAQTIQIARLHDQFKQLATTDALTGLANHRAFYVRLEEELRHAQATGGLITVAIMDLDNLKIINDTYGHLAGDEMLRAMAGGLREICRRSDYVARYGGDEFAFVLADTDREGAERAVNNLIAGLAQRTANIDGRNIPLSTGAWGMATYPEDGVRPAELVRVADQRMYANKRFSKSMRQSIEIPAGAVGTHV